MEPFVSITPAELAPVVEATLAQSKERNNDGEAAVVALHGDLGAGKTTFTQQLAVSLGVSDVVTSPTFVVMKAYETTDATFTTLIHIDAYRIEDIDELRVLHFADVLAEKQTIVVIEWAEKIAAALPAHTLHLSFAVSDDTRTITLQDHG